MRTLSHLKPIKPEGQVSTAEMYLLADAFTEFISASASLEASYEKLQLEVAYLSSELASRNSELKQSLAENERVHGALKQIVSSMPCGVLVVEADGAVTMINPEGRRLLDLGEEAIDRLSSISSASGIDFTGFLDRHAMIDGEQEFCQTAGGVKHWLSVNKRSLSLCDDAQTEKSGEQIILIVRDVTAHKQAEMERERARKATALSEVATILAHEIRNPLTSLELFAGLIAAGGDDVAECISHLRAGIRSLAGTVNNVLSIHGNGFPVMNPLNLNMLLRSSVEFTRPIADEAGVALRFRESGDGLQVMGNSSAMQQLVLNVVCNAIRHTPKGGFVSVEVASAEARPGFAKVSFSDSGTGIAPEHIDHIFSVGYSATGNSSGLGLAVCSQIVKQHQGTISVTSQRDSGTTFVVEIPTL